jgi:hypothetical protein
MNEIHEKCLLSGFVLGKNPKLGARNSKLRSATARGTQFYQVLEALRPSGVDKDIQLVSTGDVANGISGFLLPKNLLLAPTITPHTQRQIVLRNLFRKVIKKEIQASEIIVQSPQMGLVKYVVQRINTD